MSFVGDESTLYMIVSRTPYRISLFGGGTDFPTWYLKHGGSVLSCAIDKYCYLTCRYLPPFFEHKYRIVWSQIELRNTVHEIVHPAVRAVLEHLRIDSGLEVSAIGDLPARSGMATSSAFTVGLLNACHALKGRMVTKHDLAMEAIHLEQQILKENVGSQDQVCVAYGGVNKIDFLSNGEVNVTPVTIPPDRMAVLNDHLMLFFTGISRTSSSIQSQFTRNISQKESDLNSMVQCVDNALRILNEGLNINGIGQLLKEAWEIKRNLSQFVTNTRVDEMLSVAESAGALGGKVTGAGGGGFLLLFVPPDSHNQVRRALAKLTHVPFKFDYTGSQIVYARH